MKIKVSTKNPILILCFNGFLKLRNKNYLIYLKIIPYFLKPAEFIEAFFFFRSLEHIMGVNVKAIKPDTKTAAATVRAIQ